MAKANYTYKTASTKVPSKATVAKLNRKKSLTPDEMAQLRAVKNNETAKAQRAKARKIAKAGQARAKARKKK